MTQDNPSWELYRTFLGVLTQGSLSGAAREIGIAQPTVGRHVDALEKALGLVLFTRSQVGFLPTEAALALRPLAETMASTAAALQRVASGQAEGQGARGTVRITASEIVGAEVLPPILAKLRQAQPELTVELVTTNELQDLLRREADIAVRMAEPKQGALVAKRIGAIEIGMYAHREYLARCGTPRTEAELAGHTLIGFDTETPYLRAAGKLMGVRREMFHFRCDSDVTQLGAIRAGYGVGMCQVGLARRDDRLVRLLPKRFSLQLDTWLAMHEDLRDSPRCKLTFQALAKGLSEYIGKSRPAATES